MDNLTHGLTGAGIGLLLSQEVFALTADPSLVITAVIASQIPDIDAVCGARNKTTYLKHHRGFSHSFFTAPFIACGLAGVMSLFTSTSFTLLALTAFLSLALHIALDVFNAYGTKALWPLSHERFAWDILMVVDPYIIAMFTIGIAAYFFGYHGLLYALYPGLILYILSMMKHRLKARKILRQATQLSNEPIGLMPPMLGWRKWNFIISAEERYYLGKINIASKKIQFIEILDEPKACQSVEVSKDDPRVQVFLDFARYPYFSKYQTTDGDIYIRWSDLRYKLREKEHFTLWSKT